MLCHASILTKESKFQGELVKTLLQKQQENKQSLMICLIHVSGYEHLASLAFLRILRNIWQYKKVTLVMLQ